MFREPYSKKIGDNSETTRPISLVKESASGADGPGIVMLSNFIPELENATDGFMAHGFQFNGQNFWFVQHGSN